MFIPYFDIYLVYSRYLSVMNTTDTDQTTQLCNFIAKRDERWGFSSLIHLPSPTTRCLHPPPFRAIKTSRAQNFVFTLSSNVLPSPSLPSSPPFSNTLSIPHIMLCTPTSETHILCPFYIIRRIRCSVKFPSEILNVL